MFWAIYGAVFFASFAMMVREGLWSNTIALFNIIVSGLVAFGFYGPVAIYFDEMLDGQYTYVLDFVCLWGLFVVSMIVCSMLTGALSKTRMRFKHPIDPVGSSAVGLLAAWTMASIVMASLHTSPMPREAFGGGLVRSDSDVENASLFTGLTAPDIGWLKFVERVSQPSALGGSPFSAKVFVKFYAERRGKLEKAPGLKVRRG